MKKSLFALLMLGWCCASAWAQTGIEFTDKPWEQVLKQARKEKKPIFLDCYTSWCGPCKMMAKDVFTQDSVGRFYNRHFVCVKMDMEKEGKALAEKYGVRSYPTFLFIDGQSERVMHLAVGFRKAPLFVAEGERALDKRNNLAGMEERYAAGERTPEFMTTYLAALKGSGRRKECDERLDAYVKTLTDEQFATEAHWELLVGQLDFQTSPFSVAYQRFMALREAFYRVADSVQVNLRLDLVVRNYISRYVRWSAEQGRAFDFAGLQAVIDYLQTLDYPQASSWLAQLHSAEYLGKQDYRGLFEDMKQRTKQFKDDGEREYYVLLYLSRLAEAKDKGLAREALEWMKSWEREASKAMSYAKDKLLEVCGEGTPAEKGEEE